MGLLERATEIRKAESPVESPLETAAVGLRARAEAFRKESGAFVSSSPSKSGSSGIEIRGLRARAEAFRENETTIKQKKQEGKKAQKEALKETQQESFARKTPSPPIEDLLSGEGEDSLPLEEELLENILPPATESDSSAVSEIAAKAPEKTETTETLPAQRKQEASLEPELEPELEVADLDIDEPLAEIETDEESQGGLLARAEALREKKEEPIPAIEIEEEEDLLGIDEAESLLETDKETGKESQGSLDLADMESPFSDQPGLSGIEAEEELLGIDDVDGLEGLPDLKYEKSTPADDPALDAQTQTDTPKSLKDPFDTWEEEARSEAEQEMKALAPQSTDEEKKQDDFLFDDDADYSTAPLEAHIAGQKKIDHYLALFDISKEISAIDNFEDLWDNLLYAVMGEVGAESICIFSTTEKLRSFSIFTPVAYSGIPEPEGWSLAPRDAIYNRLKKSEGIVYADELLSFSSGLSEKEREMLNESQAELLFPLKNMDHFYGIVFLGPQVEGLEYNTDDMEFLKLLGEIASVGIDRVLTRRQFEDDTRELRRRNEVQARMFQLARQASLQKSLDDLYDVLATHLREDFDVTSFSVVLLSPKERCYRIFAGNQISPESMEKFRLTTDSDLIARVANLIRVYELSDFRENAEIKANYTNDDIALMSHYWIVPLINLNWLVGYIAIHETARPWNALDRELIISVAEVTSAVFANSIILSERENLFRDPFSPLEERLKKELEAAHKFHSSVSLLDLRIKNMRRLIDANSPEAMSELLASLGKAISSFLSERDFLARVGQGNFALILPGRKRQEAALFAKKLKNELRRMHLMPGSPIDVSYVTNLICYPGDTQDAGRMLAILE